MSMRTLETMILAEARLILENPKLRLKDMQEWSTSEITPHDGEVVVYVADPSVFVAVKKECDKRMPWVSPDR